MNLDFFKDKVILITGNTGFKGSWLSEILYLAGAKVIGYALKPDDNSLYNILKLDNKIKTIYGDIRDKDNLEKVINKYKPEIVIHMAAQALVLESYKNPYYTFEVNIMGTLNILEVIRSSNCVKSFLNVTTDKVYFDKIDVDDGGYKETDFLCGKDPYSNSKSCSELITYSYIKSFFDSLDYPRVSTARAGNVIGGGDFSDNRIVPDCIRYTIKNEDIVVRNYNAVRPYQYVLDCLRGYLMIVEKQYNDKDYQGNYNLGSVGIKNGDLVKLFCDKWGNIKYINLNEDYDKETKYLKLNSNLARNKLGWSQLMSIDKTISKVVEWTKAYYGNDDIIEITDKLIISYFEGAGKYEENK